MRRLDTVSLAPQFSLFPMNIMLSLFDVRIGHREERAADHRMEGR